MRPDRPGRNHRGADRGRAHDRHSGGSEPHGVTRKLRCAVYTRKSSEEGLDMEFNSLDAQREACEAYIASQRGEGWIQVADRYDDGGISGGTLDRPALKRLLADIQAGKIDIVVVYKVDRLSRSLLDFHKLIEQFERHQTTFVSITQSFNTTDAMGRMHLNIMLTFAQYEREVIGERIRDKVAASRKKGIFMGGWSPLGYEVRDRKLIIQPADAERVRAIFRRFVQLKSATLLARELVAAGATNRYGHLLNKGVLYRLLNNRVYIGEAVHKGTSYPGEHEAIIDRKLWDQAHAIIQQSPRGKHPSANACTTERSTVWTRWRRDVADPYPQRRAALSLLHQPERHEARYRRLPGQTGPSGRDRTHRHRSGPLAAPDPRGHRPDLASCSQD
jgi:site-specific DNA recombinase